MQLYYLGPKGTFSYLACRQYFSENEATFQPKSNLFEVIKAVADDDTSIGVVPIENSIEGTINIVADALAQQDVFAHGEIRLDINFALYGNGTDSILILKKCILLHQQSVKQQITYTNINLTMIMSTVQFKV